jgi:nucleoside-diphosphate-sugar epimerase
MHIAIVGCGYIGFGAAAALRRAGHNVTGIIRTGNTRLRRRLEAAEVDVFETDARNVSSYLSVIQSADVVIDCLSPAPGESVKILDAIAQIAKETKKTRRYIFTNGVMTYGDHGGKLIDETTPPNPAGCNIWKAQYADNILARNNSAEFLETVDVRPGWVYGEDFGHYVDWFGIGENDPIKYYGSKDKKWPWIHINDCSSAFVAIVEAAGSAVGGQIFNITDDTNVPNVEIQIAFAKAAGRKGDNFELQEVKELPYPLLAYSLLASSAKLQKVTGWKPKCGPLVGNEQRLYRAWKAFSEIHK